MADLNFTEQVTMLYLWKTQQHLWRQRLWVHQILQSWKQFEEYHHLLQELRLDEGRFQWYFCLSRAQFEELLSHIGGRISHQDTNYRCCIPATEHLSICLQGVNKYQLNRKLCVKATCVPY
ncbi:hypothetical protein ILYODFUR_019312 [Ilyodon furcidens]|uniref:Uncharacterized protein n=1 Tax=Ilyodon furcidens TaxID=33524 RepID=A0ABV0TBS5_9TELE